HHRVNGVLQFEDFALHVYRDFARQVATGDRCGHFSDVPNLGGEVAGHRVDGIGEVLPSAGDARDDGLSAEFTVGTDFARHAGDFRCERAQLINHRVDGFLEL